MSTADSILIHAPEPGHNRFKVARDIQNASNTSGVARELIRVVENAAQDAGASRTIRPSSPSSTSSPP